MEDSEAETRRYCRRHHTRGSDVRSARSRQAGAIREFVGPGDRTRIPDGDPTVPGDDLAVAERLVQNRILTLQDQVMALQQKTRYVSVSGTEMYVAGANLHIVNGLRATNGNPLDPDAVSPFLTNTNGLGNLIIGYNEAVGGFGDNRDGSTWPRDRFLLRLWFLRRLGRWAN